MQKYRTFAELACSRLFHSGILLKLTRDGHLTLFYMLLASSSLADTLRIFTVRGDPPEKSGFFIGRMLLRLKVLDIELNANPQDLPSLKYLLSKVDKRHGCSIVSIQTGLECSECP